MRSPLMAFICALALSSAAAAQDDPCDVKRQADAAQKKISDAEAALKTTLKNQSKPQTKRLGGTAAQLQQQLTTGQAAALAAEAGLQAAKAAATNGTGTNSATLAKAEKDLATKKQEIDKLKLDPGWFSLTTKLGPAILDSSRIAGELNGLWAGLDLRDLGGAESAITGAGASDEAVIKDVESAIQDVRSFGEPPLGRLTALRSKCASVIQLGTSLNTSIRNIWEQRNRNSGTTVAEERQANLDMKAAVENLRKPLQELRTMAQQCETDAASKLRALTTRVDEIDDLKRDPLLARMSKLEEDVEVLNSTIARLKARGLEIAARTAEAKTTLDNAIIAEEAARKLVDEIQGNLALAKATEALKGLNQKLVEFESSKSAAMTQANDVMQDAARRTDNSVKARLRKNLLDALKRDPQVIASKEGLQQRIATLPDRASKVAAVTAWKKRLATILNRRTDEEWLKLRRGQAQRLLEVRNDVENYRCGASRGDPVADLSAELLNRGTALSSASLGAGTDFAFYDDQGWEEIPWDGDLGAACTLAGTWALDVPALGSSSFSIDNSGGTRESGMGNSTGTTVLNGRRLTYTWTTVYGYDGIVVIDLNESCKEGRGTVTWTKYPPTDKRGTSFPATLTRRN